MSQHWCQVAVRTSSITLMAAQLWRISIERQLKIEMACDAWLVPTAPLFTIATFSYQMQMMQQLRARQSASASGA